MVVGPTTTIVKSIRQSYNRMHYMNLKLHLNIIYSLQKYIYLTQKWNTLNVLIEWEKLQQTT